MIKMDWDSLKQFDLIFPGIWIKGENREQASELRRALELIQSLFIEAVTSYALFQPITAENVHDHMDKIESRYERCLNNVYAKTFVFALDGIEKLLNRLCANLNSPQEVMRLYADYKKHFGHLKHIRDSAIHIEDRGRGVTRKQQPLNTHIVVIGCFIEKRFTYTGENGKQYEIEISDSTLNKAKVIIQDIINAYSWM